MPIACGDGSEGVLDKGRFMERVMTRVVERVMERVVERAMERKTRACCGGWKRPKWEQEAAEAVDGIE